LINSIALAPKLRVFLELDYSNLTPDFLAKVEVEEGRADYVDADRPRDLPYTEEILENVAGAVVVDEDGNIVAQFKGKTAFAKALRARSNARVTFDVKTDVESDEDDEAISAS
jgi:hypothetical protein